MKRRGFTIVELLMVIGILSILMTITVSAVSGSVKRARTQKANAVCALVEQGIATYYAQKGEWPVEPGTENRPKAGGDDDTDKKGRWYEYTESDVTKMIYNVVMQTKEGHPMIDVSGLFVAKRGLNYGTDFVTARSGKYSKDSTKLRVKDMEFGYPDPETGRFKVFQVCYYPQADIIKVTKQGEQDK